MCIQPKPAAVFFDFDGTLVDTMALHYEAYRSVFEGLGIELTPADFYDNVGGKASETIPKFLRGRTAPVTDAEIHRRKKALVADVFARVEIPLLPAGWLVAALSGVVPLGLVSAGARPGIDVILGRLGWTKSFAVVVTGEDCVRSKPDPEPYLLAAARLGVESSRTLVFEDTVAGIASARAAGMRVFDVSGNCPVAFL